MKIQVSQSLPLITKWIDQVVMPRSTIIQKAAITLLLLQRGEEIPQMLAVFADKNGELDTDNLKATLAKVGGKIEIPYLNWNFDQDDLDKLIGIANES